MNIRPIHMTILDLLVEDFYPLWEIAGFVEANGLFPSRETAIDAVRLGLAELVEHEMVSFWIIHREGADEIRMQAAEALRALKDDLNWAGPRADGLEIRALATDEGERVYYGGELPNPNSHNR